MNVECSGEIPVQSALRPGGGAHRELPFFVCPWRGRLVFLVSVCLRGHPRSFGMTSRNSSAVRRRYGVLRAEPDHRSGLGPACTASWAFRDGISRTVRTCDTLTASAGCRSCRLRKPGGTSRSVDARALHDPGRTIAMPRRRREAQACGRDLERTCRGVRQG